VNEEKESELAYDAMMKEYDFVASLIRLYRETQMQLVRFGVTLYAATLAFVAGTAHDDGLVEVGAVAAALVAWPIVMLVLGYSVAEIRLRRASLFIRDTLSPAVNLLLKRPEQRNVLVFERNPGVHLSKLERRLSGSGSFVLMLGGPGLVAAAWAVFITPPNFVGIRFIAAIGAAVLLVSMALTIRISQRHETRSSPMPAKASGH
jgi:hypothetical protein